MVGDGGKTVMGGGRKRVRRLGAMGRWAVEGVRRNGECGKEDGGWAGGRGGTDRSQ